ncbi:MAG: [protein-PII] uridylyltransferase [Rhodospirillales bacterium]|jgi:[protein-PII] uridylyltransferase|nr:[protein-PII] uridylyltransferase [Rhodospirillales bacterium]MBT4040805.1 [protein-PII] uridylyltransferase [Rhodospirillales bacterium]MBT5352045.1 [protein-PII] uridylyltransferase [Rhodospirillales bacterium]MBT6109445.1 [protein-PII] uridylyltransferase [Rhodospirillales bacterium]MBT6825292.1 [protein-PII] uridylyltransferase [Rhodospirillales bacterium]
MVSAKKLKGIIDGRAVAEAVQEITSWSGYSPKTHSSIFAIFQTALEQGNAEIRRRFEEEAWPASDIIRAQSHLTDQIIGQLVKLTMEDVFPAANPTKGEQIAILAAGGYGRQEMAPHSDIDLIFLVPYKMTPHTEQVVEFMLYFLWDLKLAVGHATRNVDEAIRLARDDITIRTNMLETRCIAGDKKLFKSFWKRYRTEIMDGTQNEYVEAKLGERDTRHDKMGDTRYVLEPNIKEGKGGLRDLQTLFWIAKYIYQVADIHDLVEQDVFTKEDVRLFDKASNFLWTIRCNLHFLAGREEDRLTFDSQQEVAVRMGYRDHAGTRGVERFMKHYFLIAKDVGDLTRVLCAVLEEQHKKRGRRFNLPTLPFGKSAYNGFDIETGRLNVAGRADYKAEPLKLITLFKTALENDIDIHPRALRSARQSLSLIGPELRDDPAANAAFVDILTSKRNPEKTLMGMNETGVFGRFIPDFGRVVAQMQYDMYHVYTVDEHTIRAMGILHRIEAGELADDHPLSTVVVKEIQSRRVLYIAVMLHDIAKGRKGDHSVLGAEIALKLCPRLGLNEWETETVSWLVQEHLLMSKIAFKRDLDDAQTISDFARIVQSPERLRLLLVLTVVDIRAVGPKVWNAWKATLLRDLYARAQEDLSGTLEDGRRERRIDAAKGALRDQLKGWDHDWIEGFLARGRDHYWISFDTETLSRHAHIARDVEQTGDLVAVRSTVSAQHDITEVIVYAPDSPGLFAAIAGAMALSGASIEDAKIVTLSDGMAMDTFWIQDEGGHAYDEPRRLNRLADRIQRALKGELLPGRELANARDKALPSRTQVFKVPPRVLCDNSISNSATVIEINGRDRLGLLLDLTTVLTAEGFQINSAHISTYGERVVDVFYVKDAYGLKITSESKIEALRTKLIQVLSPERRATDRGATETPSSAA